MDSWIVGLIISIAVGYLATGALMGIYIFRDWERPLFVKLPVCLLMLVFWLPMAIAANLSRSR